MISLAVSTAQRRSVRYISSPSDAVFQLNITEQCVGLLSAHIAVVYIALAQICKLCCERSGRLFARLLWTSGWKDRPSVHKAITGDYTQRACWVFPRELFALAQYGAIITLTTCFMCDFNFSYQPDLQNTQRIRAVYSETSLHNALSLNSMWERLWLSL